MSFKNSIFGIIHNNTFRLQNYNFIRMVSFCVGIYPFIFVKLSIVLTMTLDRCDNVYILSFRISVMSSGFKSI